MEQKETTVEQTVFSSTWKRHQAKKCFDCYYCKDDAFQKEHPPTKKWKEIK